MAQTTSPTNNKAIAFQGKAANRELAGAAKKSTVRKRAKKAISRGMISEKAAARHLPDL